MSTLAILHVLAYALGVVCDMRLPKRRVNLHQDGVRLRPLVDEGLQVRCHGRKHQSPLQRCRVADALALQLDSPRGIRRFLLPFSTSPQANLLYGLLVGDNTLLVPCMLVGGTSTFKLSLQ